MIIIALKIKMVVQEGFFYLFFFFLRYFRLFDNDPKNLERIIN